MFQYFSSPSERLMLFNNYTIIEFRGLLKYFGSDRNLISDIHDFLTARTVRFFESLNVNYYRNISELNFWDNGNQMIPDRNHSPEPQVNVILIPDNNVATSDSGLDESDESDEV